MSWPKVLFRFLLLAVGLFCLARFVRPPAAPIQSTPEATIAVPALSRVAVQLLGFFHKP